MFAGRKELSASDVTDIQKKAKDSQLLAPTPEQVEFRKKIFGEIDAATIGSGVVPRFHEVIERLSGKRYKIIIFDAVELSVGTPLPIATRYMLPATAEDLTYDPDSEVNEKEPKLSEMPDFIPGLIIRRWPAGMTDVQLGIDMQADAFKLYPRFRSVSHHWREGRSFVPPHWWPYKIAAEDITQEYDLMIPINMNVALVYADDMDHGLDYFTVGGRDYLSNVEEVRYSIKAPDGNGTVVVWNQDENQQKVNTGFQYMETYFAENHGKGTESSSY